MKNSQTLHENSPEICTEAIILAGGMGTRLKNTAGDVPKPMAEINGRPFLEYLMDYLCRNGITHIILSVGYKAAQIENHFGNRFKNSAVSYSRESKPLGTGGGILRAMQQAKTENVVIVNGDTLFDIDLQRLSTFHNKNRAILTVALKKTEDTSRYGSIGTEENGRITAFFEKAAGQGAGLINGGTYIVSTKKFMELGLPEQFSFEKDFLEKFYEKEYFWGLEFEGYFIDIGTPSAYKQAQTDFLKII